MPEYLEFEVGKADVFKKSISTIQKLVDDACFEVRDGRIRLAELDPSHIALIHLELDNDIVSEFRDGDKFCFKTEKMKTILDRLHREDETVKLSVVDEKIMVSMPQTKRAFSIAKREELESQNIPKIEWGGAAVGKVSTAEFKSMVKDMMEIGCERVVLDDTKEGLLATCETDEGDVYTKRYGTLPGTDSKSKYSLSYVDNMITTAFERAELKWKTDSPLSVSYPLGPKSDLEFWLAPVVE